MKRNIIFCAAGAAILSFVLMAAGTPHNTAAAQQANAVEIDVSELADGLHLIAGGGGNAALLKTGAAVILVDDKVAPLSERLKALVQDVAGAPVDFVINTHWHHDHTGGNEEFGNTGSVIIAHENVRRRVSVEQFREEQNRTSPALPESGWPVVTFTETVTLHPAGETMRVIHVPHGHTDGDSIVYFEQRNVLHMGDVFFNGGFPYVDWGSGGSIGGLIAGLDRGLEIADDNTIVIPGHGAVTDRATMKQWRDMIVTVRARVAEHLAAGLSAEEVIAAGPAGEYAQEFGTGFIPTERFVRAIITTQSGPVR